MSWDVTADDWRQRLHAEDIDAARLAISAPASLLPDVLGSPSVASAFIEVTRSANALRRRPWRWPLRVASLGIGSDAAAAFAGEVEHAAPGNHIDVRRAEEEPGAIDVLVIGGPLGHAVALVDDRQGPLANSIVVVGADHGWRYPKAKVDRLRLVTGAVAVALFPGRDAASMVGQLVWEMSHAVPFDVAVTRATGGRALIVGERAGLDRAELPMIARRMARQAHISHAELAMAEPPDRPLPPPPPTAGAEPIDLGDADHELTAIASRGFRHEHEDAADVARVGAGMEAELARHEREPRWLQATLGDGQDERVLRRGVNDLAVFIGPRRAGAAAAPQEFADTDLPWDAEDAEAFRLTIGFVPLYPRGIAQTHQVELPRIGSSGTAHFRWAVRTPPDAAADFVASARILVIFRNRVLQTTVVSGAIGTPITLSESVGLRPDFGDLDDRQAFDVAFFANHDNRNTAALIRASKGHITFDPMAGLDGIVTQLSNILGDTVNLVQTKQGIQDERCRQLLISLAGKGRDLYQALQQLGSLAKAKRIQMVSARSSWFLPIELAYERFAPDDDAVICPKYLDGKTTCDAGCAAVTDRKVVCPNAFFGMQRIVERIAYDPLLHADLDGKFLILVAPRANDRRLSVELAAVAASSRVRPVDVTGLVTALGQESIRADTWDEWTDAIAHTDLDLLVLLPHTEYGPRESFMEIGKKSRLERGHIETDFVRRNEQLKPAVVLFGCKTSGTADDATGFANRFMQNGAAVVFGSLTLLLGRHAAALAQLLTDDLRATGERRSVGEVLRDFRQRSVRAGLLAGLAVTAYGDADWTV